MTTMRTNIYLLDVPPSPMLRRHIALNEGAHCDLYGWDVDPPPVDSGPPKLVEEAFAAALVRCGTLAFLAYSDRSARPPGWVVANEGSWLRIPPSLLDRIRRRLPPSVLATSHAETARQMFSGSVSWSEQHQVGILLRPGPMPIFDRRLLVDLLGARDVPLRTLELPGEVIALIFPAVDGDYLELVARETATRDAMRAVIVDECGHRRVSFSVRNTIDSDIRSSR